MVCVCIYDAGIEPGALHMLGRCCTTELYLHLGDEKCIEVGGGKGRTTDIHTPPTLSPSLSLHPQWHAIVSSNKVMESTYLGDFCSYA
jgi:hypothetical protein